MVERRALKTSVSSSPTSTAGLSAPQRSNGDWCSRTVGSTTLQQGLVQQVCQLHNTPTGTVSSKTLKQGLVQQDCQIHNAQTGTGATGLSAPQHFSGGWYRKAVSSTTLQGLVQQDCQLHNAPTGTGVAGLSAPQRSNRDWCSRTISSTTFQQGLV